MLVTAAGQIGERIARAREESLRRAQALSEQQARELASRLAAERSAARLELAEVYRAQWWDQATPDQISHAHQVARAWSGEDPEAVRAEQRIRDEVRTRFGVDVDDAHGVPAAVRAAVERADLTWRGDAPSPAHAGTADELRQAREWFAQHDPQWLEQWESQYRGADTLSGMRSGERALIEAWRSRLAAAEVARPHADAEHTRAAEESAEAHQLMQLADREDAAAEQARATADHEPDPDERAAALRDLEDHHRSARAARVAAEPLYDSAERRGITAQEMKAQGVPPEQVATMMRADVSQARPATEATKSPTGRAPKARRSSRTRGAQVQRTGLDG
ncbi:hypothetical protein [Cellulomonas carbonis]|uniref:hypothetical protein n=1 Tax=Cellulomonas carbonis TaxID=1386092 RepID=UPI0016674FDA|nr:hypothetical protein [Cellulomonas carbonis]